MRAVVTDFNGDGKSDILWFRDDGTVSVWDSGDITHAHWLGPRRGGGGWHIKGVGDFDGNGNDDVLWRRDDATVSVWDNGDIAHAHWIADPGQVASSWYIV